LRVDGGIKSGWDIVVAAMMGSEEFGFGSLAMIAEGCIMARVCHMNSCPVGVATQRKELRKKFPGTPEHVANFMLFVAEEVRTILAALGYRSLDEIIGRGDLLRPRGNTDVRTNVPQPAVASGMGTKQEPLGGPKRLSKAASVDLSSFYTDATPDEEDRASWVGITRNSPAHANGPVLDDNVLQQPEIKQLLDQNSGVVQKQLEICNTDRSVGGRIAGAIARKHGNYGFHGKLNLTFSGSAGQSFGVWNIQGVNLRVIGECNDYVGKGMCGGTIVVSPHSDSTFKAEDNVIAGNTCLYGATGGEVFLSGRAGERFGVRNAGCHAVIEGAGDHLGEYMTNGIVVSLGRVGRNLGAGMSGGLIYVYDPEDQGLQMNELNAQNLFRVTSDAGEQQLRGLIEKHQQHTGSVLASAILKDWPAAQGKFWQVAPVSEQGRAEVSPMVEAPATATSEQPAVVAAARRQRSSSPPQKGRNEASGRWGGSSP